MGLALRISLLAVAVGAVGVAQAAPAERQVAGCEPAFTTHGSGPPNWRARSRSAGPLGVFRRALKRMSEAANGQLTTKMPIIVEGHASVTLSVPPGQRRRVFLYYGRYLDRQGEPTRQISGAPGFAEIEFQPCAYKPRTVWPGGIRVRGRAPVRLLVRVAGSDEPIPLRLGRPTPYRPPAG